MSSSIKAITANNRPIAWPPTRQSMVLLFQALNLRVSPTQLIDALIYSRGPKMEDEPPENFSLDNLVQWFLLNLKTLKHIDFKIADADWKSVSPQAATASARIDHQYLSPMHSPRRSPGRFLRKSPQAHDAYGYLSARQKLYKTHQKKNTITGNWGLAAQSVEEMLKHSSLRHPGMDDFDEEEMFDKMGDMGIFQTGLPKLVDRSKLEAWDQSRLTNPSPTGNDVSYEDLDDDRHSYQFKKEFITLPHINDASA